MSDPEGHRGECTDRITLVSAGKGDDGDELAELRDGLSEPPLEISSKHFYDAKGSALFERICELPEYYQTRTESELLRRWAPRIIEVTGARELVEIGSGAATKTRLILSAMDSNGGPELYIPLDVDEEMLIRVGEELCREFPALRVYAVGGDFAHSLAHLPAGSQRLFIFLGGTIGNLRPADEAPDFLRAIACRMNRDDFLLLGTDLIKETSRLEAAYNDSLGVTAEFNRNILKVINRKAKADFDPDAYRHRAFYDTEKNWIEMRLVAEREQRVTLEAIDLAISVAAGQEIRTEISAKYDRESATALLDRADLELVDWFSDEEQLFGLALAHAV